MTTIRIAQMVPDTEAEGPGRRYAVWVQGCPIRCPGCCNPEMFKDDAGTVWDVAEIAARITQTPGIEGMTLLAQTEGVFAETAGGVTVGVLKKLVKQGLIKRTDTTVALITGNGLKTQEAVMHAVGRPTRISPSLVHFEKMFNLGKHER